MAVQEEQVQDRVMPKQPTPCFFGKLETLCGYLHPWVFRVDISPAQRYIAARDLAFFCLEFFSANRASDLGRTLTKEIGRLPNDEGFFFSHKFGKTLRWGNTNSFIIKRCTNQLSCPVANLDLYVKLCDLMNVHLRGGYLFRTR